MVRAARTPHPPLLFVVVALLLVTAFATACSSPTDRDQTNGDATPNEPPGIYQSEGGESRIIGVVVRRDLEGGFWAIADAETSADAEAAQNLAVLIPSQTGVVTEVQFAEAEGHLVEVKGILSDGPSIYMAGPLLEVEELQVVGDAEL